MKRARGTRVRDRRDDWRCRAEDGGVAAEYAAVTAFIAGAVALAVSAFGTRVVGLIELL